MITECPHCKKRFAVSIKTVLDWIGRSAKLRSAVNSQAASHARAAAKPENMIRNVDYAALARKSHAKRRENAAEAATSQSNQAI